MVRTLYLYCQLPYEHHRLHTLRIDTTACIGAATATRIAPSLLVLQHSHALTTGSPALKKSGQNIQTLTAHSHGRHANPAMNSVDTNSRQGQREPAQKWQHRVRRERCGVLELQQRGAARGPNLSLFDRLRALSRSKGSPSIVSTTRSILPCVSLAAVSLSATASATAFRATDCCCCSPPGQRELLWADVQRPSESSN